MPNKPDSFKSVLAREPNLFRKMALINFSMDVMKDPDEAFCSYNIPGEIYLKWAEANDQNIIKQVSKETGADPAQLADKEKRTTEQQQALYEAASRASMARIKNYLNSNYCAAIEYLVKHGQPDVYNFLVDTLAGKDTLNEMPSAQRLNVPHAAILYFFATHEDIDPRKQACLTEEHKAMLMEDYIALDDFYKAHWEEINSPSSLLQAYLETIKPNQAEAQETLKHIALTRAELIEYPLDKVNSTIWGLSEQDTAEQIMFRAEKAGSSKEINILYSIDFDELGDDVKITKQLTAYDKRVYIAVSALFNAGNSIITLTQIHYAMGYTSRPRSSDLKNINDSITKMLGANIYISNEQEAAAYKYDKFVYKGSLLPYEQVEVIANGKLTESAIHIFREPPVITFAKQRKQITSIDVKLLQSPISKTDGNLQIDDYLIERISRAKNGKQPHRILYKTLYEKTNITEKKQKQRAADKIKQYLEHYQKCGMITRYTMEADGITVYFPQ